MMNLHGLSKYCSAIFMVECRARSLGLSGEDCAALMSERGRMAAICRMVTTVGLSGLEFGRVGHILWGTCARLRSAILHSFRYLVRLRDCSGECA